jgi:hypothetical protein
MDQSSNNNMNFQGEYVYVIEEREFVKSGEQVYKVGRSANILKRMAQYPNGSQVRMVINVNDSVKAEQEILSQLKKYGDITHRKDIGAEYFQGHLCFIINTMSQVANMLYGERNYTVLQDVNLEESDSNNVCETEVINDTNEDVEDVEVLEDVEDVEVLEDVEDVEVLEDVEVVEDVVVDTKPDNSIEDPVVIINEYLTNNASDIDGKTVNAIDFYKTVMGAVNLPKRFAYTRFVAILNKYKIKEYDTIHGPVFMFPVVPKTAIVYEDLMCETKSNEQNMMDFISEYIVKDVSSYFTLKQAKDAFKASIYFTGEVFALKNGLQNFLKCVCINQKKINKRVERNVFMGYKVL